MLQKGFSQLLFFWMVYKMMSLAEIMKEPLERLD